MKTYIALNTALIIATIILHGKMDVEGGYRAIQNPGSNPGQIAPTTTKNAGFQKNPGQNPGRIRRCKVTAYCPCSICCGKWAGDGQTANGHRIQPGDKFVACDRSVPFKTVVNVPGYGKVLCLDRGGAIKGDKVDVYFSTHQEARNWGVKYLDVIFMN